MNELESIRNGLEAAYRTVKSSPGMGGFITGACFIEWLASFYFGGRVTPEQYKKFVRKFLPKYDAERLYHGIRCGLVHMYTENGPGQLHDFDEKHPPHKHLERAPVKGDSKKYLVILRLENFKADLQRAMKGLFQVLERDAAARKRAGARYRRWGLISGKVETV